MDECIIFRFYFYLLFLFGSNAVVASNLGISPIRNIESEIYGAGTQNWDVREDKRGFLYFANNEGLLVYSGESWKIFPLRNRTICRSLYIADDGKIYVGGQGEIGYFIAGIGGRYEYHVLNDLIPEEYVNFEDVWDIIAFQDRLFFRTNKLIFELSSNTIIVHELGADLVFMGEAGNQLYVQGADNVLYKWNEDKFGYYTDKLIDYGIITGIFALEDDQLLIATLSNGFWLLKNQELTGWNNELNAFLSANKIYCVAHSSNTGEIAIGTSLNGVLVLEESGRISKHLSKSSGLQNNNVLSIGFDHNDDLWVGLNNGIDYIQLSAAVTRIFPDGEDLEGPVYAAIIHEGWLYLGTSNGLYTIPWNEYYNPLREEGFRMVKNSSGQVWSLNVIQGDLFMGHHQGAFLISEEEAIPVSSFPGTWKFVDIAKDTMITGNYSGLEAFAKVDGKWVPIKRIDGFNESSRIMEWADHQLWIAHPYRGVFRIRFDKNLEAEVKFYNHENGLPSDLFNHVFHIKEELVFAGEKGIYRYNDETDKFEAYEEYNRLLGKENRTQFMVDDRDGNLWFVVNDRAGWIRIRENGLEREMNLQYFPPLSNQMVGGFEMIYPVNEGNVFFGANKGVFHLNLAKFSSYDEEFSTYFNEVTNTGIRDSVTYSGTLDVLGKHMQAPVFFYYQNGMTFDYATNEHFEQNRVEFQYKLEGSETEWSSWSSASEKEYTNLPPGKYQFMVRARNSFGQITEPKVYDFEIKPAWYANNIAYGIYLLLFLGVTLTFFLLQRKTFIKEKEKLELQKEQMKEQHIEEVAASEREIVALKNENLMTQIQHKNKELASTTMHLVQKMEMVKTLQEELKKVMLKDNDPESLKKEVQRLIRLLNTDEQLDDEWEHFSHHFDEVHHHFFQRLSDRYPHLSPNDHRLCAYLRMNLSTKEIAHLLNLSVRGVEASRYRLRKKLDLPTEVNLTEFMMKF